MKDTNLKALEELTGLLDIIRIFKYEDVDDNDLYKLGYNLACEMITGYVGHRIDKMESEVML